MHAWRWGDSANTNLILQKCRLGISYCELMKLSFVCEEKGRMLFVALILKLMFKQIYKILDNAFENVKHFSVNL